MEVYFVMEELRIEVRLAFCVLYPVAVVGVWSEDKGRPRLTSLPLTCIPPYSPPSQWETPAAIEYGATVPKTVYSARLLPPTSMGRSTLRGQLRYYLPTQQPLERGARLLFNLYQHAVANSRIDGVSKEYATLRLPPHASL